MQYLLTSNEQIRLQVTAAIAEAEGLGEVVATDSFDRLREALSTGDVSCVLVDEALADVSAMSAVQEISQAHPLLPVVLLTRGRSAEVLTAAMDAGARTVLSLPLSFALLSALLAAVLSLFAAPQPTSPRPSKTAAAVATICLFQFFIASS